MNEPIEQEPLRPHSYDGIQEYDKKLPNWWLFTLYGTIIFSIGYWYYYHKSDHGPDQIEEYRQALALLEDAAAEQAAAAPALSNERLWAMSQDAAAVEAGKTTYMTMCMSCHGPQLEGGVGVSLADSEWIHGSAPLDVRKTISEGVIEKGMLAWEPILGADKVNEVTAFVLSYHSKP